MDEVLTSPCIGVCRIDAATGWCAGCARTKEEISAWREVGADLRERIWTALPERRATLGIRLHRLDWSARRIRSVVEDSLRPGAGVWVFGIYGAVAEFCIGPAENVELALGADQIEAATPRAGLRMAFSKHLRALAIGTEGAADMRTIILAMARARARLVSNSGLSALGPDRAALRPAERSHELYDFGLGSPVSQFCIHTADPCLQASLDERVGQTWPDLLAGIGRRIFETSPGRVVTSPLGRIEVLTPIRSPDVGRHHLGLDRRSRSVPAAAAAG
jgi:predicted Fe-S protein YdhL (DUF1289 family)